MITGYSFGMMEIDGKVYRKDLMIFPDGAVHHPWWRISGHSLTFADIEPIIAVSPATLVVGTGNSGMMRPDSEFAPSVEARGIHLIILPTSEAVREFNRLSVESMSCAGCFHLTC